MVTPTGVLSKPLDYLRQTVAGSASFRAATSTASQALALANVHAVSYASPSQTFFAVVDLETGWALESDGGGVRNYFDATGDLQLLFQQTITESADIDAAYDFLNTVGAVLSEMLALSGTAAYLNITGVRLVDGPYRPDDEESASAGDYYRAVFTVSYRGVPE